MPSQLDFFEMPLSDKVNTLYREGDALCSIRYYGYKINLYLIWGFYVEVFYNHKQDRIEKIEPFSYANTRIKFYMDQIKLPAIGA